MESLLVVPGFVTTGFKAVPYYREVPHPLGSPTPLGPMGSQLAVPQKPQPTLRCLAEQFWVGAIPGEAPLGRQRALGSLP